LAAKPESVCETIEGAELIDLGGEIPIYMDKVFDEEDFKKIRFL